MVPLMKLIPGMSQTPEAAARRYLQASEFGTDVSGQFFASPPKKLTGPIEVMRHPHSHDTALDGSAEEKSTPETLTTACHAASWLTRS